MKKRIPKDVNDDMRDFGFRSSVVGSPWKSSQDTILAKSAIPAT